MKTIGFLTIVSQHFMRICAVGITALTCTGGANAGPSAVSGATEWTQLANNAELLNMVGLQGETLAKNAQILTAELTQVKTQIDTYMTILRNTAQLPESFMREAMEPILKLRAIAQEVGGIAKDGASLDKFLRSDLFTDPLFDKTALTQAATSERYDEWSETWAKTLETSLRSAGLTQEDVASEGAVLDKISARIGKEGGHMQALQLANELSGSLARQMNQLRSITATQSEQTAVAWGRVLSDMDRKEAADRALEKATQSTLNSIQSQGGNYRSVHEILGIGQ